MRPVRVEFQAFGPYVGREIVDFEAMSEKGLFLICGKTGTGKTMIQYGKIQPKIQYTCLLPTN